MIVTCSVNGCDRESKKRTLCETHYARLRKHGDTSITLKSANGDGYVQGGYLGHQINGVRKFDHVRIAENVLGKPLPKNAVVHHVNEIKTDNRNENLVICPDKAYHNLIHARTDAINATGNPDSRKCKFCKNYDLLENLSIYKSGNTNQYSHAKCGNLYRKNNILKGLNHESGI